MAAIKKVAPLRLVESDKDDLGAFFLVLAVIYNDIKGLIYLIKYFNKFNNPPKEEIISAYLGEYNGMTSQHFKIIAGVVNEFFIFLKAHEELFHTPQFQLVLLKVPKPAREDWHDLLDAAFERTTNRNGLGNKLMLIRNNIAFHYDQSEKELVRSYHDFFSDKTRFGADHAYYSDGGTIQDTRFYYADAAIQQYMLKTANKEYKKDFIKDVVAYRALQTETYALVRKMNMVLANLLRQFVHIRLER